MKDLFVFSFNVPSFPMAWIFYKVLLVLKCHVQYGSYMLLIRLKALKYMIKSTLECWKIEESFCER